MKSEARPYEGVSVRSIIFLLCWAPVFDILVTYGVWQKLVEPPRVCGLSPAHPNYRKATEDPLISVAGGHAGSSHVALQRDFAAQPSSLSRVLFLLRNWARVKAGTWEVFIRGPFVERIDEECGVQAVADAWSYSAVYTGIPVLYSTAMAAFMAWKLVKHRSLPLALSSLSRAYLLHACAFFALFLCGFSPPSQFCRLWSGVCLRAPTVLFIQVYHQALPFVALPANAILHKAALTGQFPDRFVRRILFPLETAALVVMTYGVIAEAYAHTACGALHAPPTSIATSLLLLHGLPISTLLSTLLAVALLDGIVTVEGLLQGALRLRNQGQQVLRRLVCRAPPCMQAAGVAAAAGPAALAASSPAEYPAPPLQPCAWHGVSSSNCSEARAESCSQMQRGAGSGQCGRSGRSSGSDSGAAAGRQATVHSMSEDSTLAGPRAAAVEAAGSCNQFKPNAAAAAPATHTPARPAAPAVLAQAEVPAPSHSLLHPAADQPAKHPRSLPAAAARAADVAAGPACLSPGLSDAALHRADEGDMDFNPQVTMECGTISIHIPHMDPSQLPSDWMERLQAHLREHHPDALILGHSLWQGSIHITLDVGLLRRPPAAAAAAARLPGELSASVSSTTDSPAGASAVSSATPDGALGLIEDLVRRLCDEANKQRLMADLFHGSAAEGMTSSRRSSSHAGGGPGGSSGLAAAIGPAGWQADMTAGSIPSLAFQSAALGCAPGTVRGEISIQAMSSLCDSAWDMGDRGASVDGGPSPSSPPPLGLAGRLAVGFPDVPILATTLPTKPRSVEPHNRALPAQRLSHEWLWPQAGHMGHNGHQGAQAAQWQSEDALQDSAEGAMGMTPEGYSWRRRHAAAVASVKVPPVAAVALAAAVRLPLALRMEHELCMENGAAHGRGANEWGLDELSARLEGVRVVLRVVTDSDPAGSAAALPRACSAYTWSARDLLVLTPRTRSLRTCTCKHCARIAEVAGQGGMDEFSLLPSLEVPMGRALRQGPGVAWIHLWAAGDHHLCSMPILLVTHTPLAGQTDTPAVPAAPLASDFLQAANLSHALPPQWAALADALRSQWLQRGLQDLVPRSLPALHAARQSLHCRQVGALGAWLAYGRGLLQGAAVTNATARSAATGGGKTAVALAAVSHMPASPPALATGCVVMSQPAVQHHAECFTGCGSEGEAAGRSGEVEAQWLATRLGGRLRRQLSAYDAAWAAGSMELPDDNNEAASMSMDLQSMSTLDPRPFPGAPGTGAGPVSNGKSAAAPAGPASPLELSQAESLSWLGCAVSHDSQSLAAADMHTKVRSVVAAPAAVWGEVAAGSAQLAAEGGRQGAYGGATTEGQVVGPARMDLDAASRSFAARAACVCMLLGCWDAAEEVLQGALTAGISIAPLMLQAVRVPRPQGQGLLGSEGPGGPAGSRQDASATCLVLVACSCGHAEVVCSLLLFLRRVAPHYSFPWWTPVPAAAARAPVALSPGAAAHMTGGVLPGQSVLGCGVVALAGVRPVAALAASVGLARCAWIVLTDLAVHRAVQVAAWFRLV